MRRRDIIGLLAGTMAWPFAACAQQRAQAPRIAMLIASYTEADKAGQVRITAFLTVLQTLGMNPHRDIRIDYHWGGGSIERHC